MVEIVKNKKKSTRKLLIKNSLGFKVSVVSNKTARHEEVFPQNSLWNKFINRKF